MCVREFAMSRFFFHFSADNDLVLDETGREFRNLQQAHAYAGHLISFACLASPRIRDDKRWVLRIVDEDGPLALAVTVPVRTPPSMH